MTLSLCMVPLERISLHLHFYVLSFFRYSNLKFCSGREFQQFTHVWLANEHSDTSMQPVRLGYNFHVLITKKLTHAWSTMKQARPTANSKKVNLLNGIYLNFNRSYLSSLSNLMFSFRSYTVYKINVKIG